MTWRVVSPFTVAGSPRVYKPGELVGDDDPVLKGRERLFARVADAVPVEQATAAPGEKRSTRRSHEAG